MPVSGEGRVGGAGARCVVAWRGAMACKRGEVEDLRTRLWRRPHA